MTLQPSSDAEFTIEDVSFLGAISRIAVRAGDGAPFSVDAMSADCGDLVPGARVRVNLRPDITRVVVL